jgi:hypothetical protein
MRCSIRNVIHEVGHRGSLRTQNLLEAFMSLIGNPGGAEPTTTEEQQRRLADRIVARRNDTHYWERGPLKYYDEGGAETTGDDWSVARSERTGRYLPRDEYKEPDTPLANRLRRLEGEAVGSRPASTYYDEIGGQRQDIKDRENQPQNYGNYSTTPDNADQARAMSEKYGDPGPLSRDPTKSEREFFLKNPGIPGYASEDGRVVMNPDTSLSPEEQQAVQQNEWARIQMRQPGMAPKFNLSAEQASTLNGLPHYDTASDEDRRSTIAARLYSGDPSGGQATPEQQEYLSNTLTMPDKQRSLWGDVLDWVWSD